MIPARFLAATSAVALLALTGCDGSLAQRQLDYNDTEDVKITQITVESGAGDVTVHTSAISNVRINRVLRYHGAEPAKSTYRLDGTHLFISTDCGRLCSASYEITAPQGVTIDGENGSGDVNLTGVAGVNLRVGSGDIDVSDASGAVRVETGSGDINLTNTRGAVNAHAGSGNVVGRELSGGGQVESETGSGDVSLTLTTAAPVRARASSGDVELDVPAASYRVRADSGSGSKDIAVTNDPAAAMLLDVSTGSGDLTIRQS